MYEAWASHSNASASANGRDGTASEDPAGVRKGLESNVTVYHDDAFCACSLPLLEGNCGVNNARICSLLVGYGCTIPFAE